MEPRLMKLIVYSVISCLIYYSGITMDSVFAWLILSASTLLISLTQNIKLKFIILILYSISAYFYPSLVWGLCLLLLDFDTLLSLFISILAAFIISPYPDSLIQSLIILLTYYLASLTHKLQSVHDDYTVLTNTMQSQGIHENKLREELIHNQEIELEMSVLDERNRIARDIHDNVGHLLSSALLQVGALQTLNRNEAIDPLFLTLKDTLDDGMNSIRMSVHALYRDSYDLDRELQQILNTFTSLEFNYSYQITSNISTPIQATLIYCVKEALTNTVKHSNANTVVMKFTESEHHIYCIVHDNGTFSSPSSSPGIGLASIEKRVRNLNGILNIQTDNGYRLYLSIPKE